MLLLLDLTDGVGLGGFELPEIRKPCCLFDAEAGKRGGGIESCRTEWCSALSSCVRLILDFELLRFQDRLSFLLSELIDDGVGGSSGLGRGTGDLGLDTTLGARGPDGLIVGGCSGGTSEGPSSGRV